MGIGQHMRSLAETQWYYCSQTEKAEPVRDGKCIICGQKPQTY
jgi:hypothetical protein